MADPLEALLDRSKLTDAQRAGLFDLFHAAKNTSDLESRLDSMELPLELKADLWDLKAGAKPTSAETPKTEPSAGYWEDRGIAGKVWHPAKAPAAERKDRNVISIGSGSQSTDPDTFGIDPEAVAIIGNAALTPIVGATSRVGAGVKAAAGAAGPLVKYHAVNQSLRMLGAPGWLAESAGALAAGRRGGAKAAEEATAAEASTVSAAKAESPLEVTRRLKTEWRTSRGLPAEGYPPKVDAETVKQEFKAFFNPAKPATAEAAANVPKLKVQETALAMKLLKSGLKSDEVLDTILELRKMPVSWRTLPTDAEVASIVAARKAAQP